MHLQVLANVLCTILQRIITCFDGLVCGKPYKNYRREMFVLLKTAYSQSLVTFELLFCTDDICKITQYLVNETYGLFIFVISTLHMEKSEV